MEEDTVHGVPFLVNLAKYGYAKEFPITNIKQVRFWDFEGLGYPRPYIKLPARLVLLIFSLLKGYKNRRVLGVIMKQLISSLLASSTRTFNCNAAKKYLGYTPFVALEDGIASTIQWFSRDLDKSDDTFAQSSADQLLGCGKVLGLKSRIPPWRFEISESTVRDLSRDIVVAWNHGVRSFKSLSRGGDWIKCLKVQFYSFTHFSNAHPT